METLAVDWNMFFPLILNTVMSLIGFVVTLRLLPMSFELFLKAGLSGRDMSKKTPPSGQKVLV